MQIQSLTYRGDPVKKIKFADLHSMGAWCFYPTPTHLSKLRFSYTENRNVQACEGALKGFLFESSFPYDTCFNAFVLFLVLNCVWRTIEDSSVLTVSRNEAKTSFAHVYTIKHPLTIKLMRTSVFPHFCGLCTLFIAQRLSYLSRL